MRLDGADEDNRLSVFPDMDEPGPSSRANGSTTISNGHSITNGASGRGTLMISNGASSSSSSKSALASSHSSILENGHTRSISRVNLSGTKLYPDSFVDREEFVRLVAQTLRDVGYLESAATLEAESGYTTEDPSISEFRRCIVEGLWHKAMRLLYSLGVPDDADLRVVQFLIGQQKYLELLEVRNVTGALNVLRNELAPLNDDPDRLHFLSGLIMCSDINDLKARANWDGSSGNSREELLRDLQHYIPPSIMLPQRRMNTLLEQAYMQQRTQCLYHNAPYTSSAFSLYSDHRCSREAFPSLTTNILAGHEDEVWNIQWSHDGNFLASAGKDKTAMIWCIDCDDEGRVQWTLEKTLGEHQYSVGCIAWSMDDTVILTSSEHIIKMWNVATGTLILELDAHTETVAALIWLPDNSKFLSASMDRKIYLWDADGKYRQLWCSTNIRISDLALSPDLSKLVAIGMLHKPVPTVAPSNTAQENGTPPTSAAQPLNSRQIDYFMLVYDFSSKAQLSVTPLHGESTSVKISQDSRYALVNHTPDEVQLWDIEAARLARKYTGQSQGRHVIRSCFGGVDGNFVVSGSEDGCVYVWHRDTGALLEILKGHGSGSVNSVAWNPKDESMLASCSDDHSIRIWEAPPPEFLQNNSSNVVLNGKSKGKGRDLREDGQLTLSTHTEATNQHR